MKPRAATPAEEAFSELRIRTEAAHHCLALADAAPPSLVKLLHRRLAERHIAAIIRILPPGALAGVFAEDVSP
jgi:hypothetical protein